MPPVKKTARKGVHPKVKAVAGAGTLTTTLLVIAGLLHVNMSEALAAALATVIVTIAGIVKQA